MQIKDMGALDGPVLLYGGPYFNLEATTALFDAADRLGIRPESRICTGDVVGYCADGPKTVDAVRRLGGTVVAGNCEKQLSGGGADCGCGFDEGSVCADFSVGWYGFAQKTMSLGDCNWMGQRPDLAVFTHQGRRYGVIHGGVTDISRFVWSTSPKSVFENEIACLRNLIGEIDGVIAGHSGIAFSRWVDGVHWINPGVIGMPPNNGTPATEYAVLKGGQVSFCRLLYNAKGASQSMVQAGQCFGYESSLLTGFWPSEDVLPDDLRRAISARR